MNRFIALLAFTFAGSVAGVLATRGGYFYNENALGFGRAENLWLALGVGVLYVLGALPSHRIAHRFGERNMLLATTLAQGLIVGVIQFWPTKEVIIAGQLVYPFFNALMWPVVESYISAGRSPRQTASALGIFNVVWSLAVPVGVYASGPIIDGYRQGIFGLAGLLFLLSILPALVQSPQPLHMAHDHPDRPAEQQRNRLAALLLSSRWLLLYSYALFFLLPPLVPEVFKKFYEDIGQRTALASSIDASRFLIFIVMSLWPGWHGRSSILIASVIVLPLTLLGVMFGESLAIVLTSAILFGIAEGLVYYAALYYGMVVKNASVDAGGVHESLIGLGFAIGPAAGLVGHYIGERSEKIPYTLGMLAGIAPLMLICTIGSLLPLWRLRRS